MFQKQTTFLSKLSEDEIPWFFRNSSVFSEKKSRNFSFSNRFEFVRTKTNIFDSYSVLEKSENAGARPSTFIVVVVCGKIKINKKEGESA